MEARLLKSAICRVKSFNRPYPSLFFFPGLQSFPFWDVKKIPSIAYIESNYDVIKKEFQQRKVDLDNDYKLIDKEHSLHNGKWEWYNFISKGKTQGKFKENFPITYDILSNIDEMLLDLPFAYSFFSVLDKKASISEHYGPCNIRLRIHLGIDIPDNCSITVAGEQRTWQDGKCIVFDDTYLHSVKNDNSNKCRVILLIDIWHPDLTKEERHAIVDMFKIAENKGWIKNL